MTDTPRRRRRWLWIVLAMGLFFGGGLGWWYWPRGDVRFVGRWAFGEKSQSEPVGELVLSRHGMGQFTAQGEPYLLSFRWETYDGELILGTAPKGSVNKWTERAAELLMEWTGHSFLPEQESYRFEIVNSDEIRLTEGIGKPEVVLKRLTTQ